MSTVRVLIKQGKKIYRLLRVEDTSDGSILVLVDRDPAVPRGIATMNPDGEFTPKQNIPKKPTPHAKFSIHTTGEVHYYPSVGGPRTNTIWIEPLPRLTKTSPFGFYSIPRVSFLERFTEDEHRCDVKGALEIPEHISERITFLLEIGPKPLPKTPDTYGLSIDYDIYSLVIRLLPQPPVPVSKDLIDHFINGASTLGDFDSRQISKAEAELELYQSIHGQGPLVFREDSGANVLLATAVMAKPPKLNRIQARRLAHRNHPIRDVDRALTQSPILDLR